MKANELMIGDWVQCTYWHNPHILQVYELKRVGDDELKIVVVEDALPLVFQEVYIEPIPLTAEILEKNGLKEKGAFYRLAFSDYGLYISEITESIWKVQFYNHECSAFDSIICVGYVHELQHALRLCGIDKEIVL